MALAALAPRRPIAGPVVATDPLRRRMPVRALVVHQAEVVRAGVSTLLTTAGLCETTHVASAFEAFRVAGQLGRGILQRDDLVGVLPDEFHDRGVIGDGGVDRGVAAGANSPCHSGMSSAGMPTSFADGTCGTRVERFGAPTKYPLSLPSLISGAELKLAAHVRST